MACVVVEARQGCWDSSTSPRPKHTAQRAHTCVHVSTRAVGVYYMILIHIYPGVALNAACEMSRTGERERNEGEKQRERERKREGVRERTCKEGGSERGARLCSSDEEERDSDAARVA